MGHPVLWQKGSSGFGDVGGVGVLRLAMLAQDDGKNVEGGGVFFLCESWVLACGSRIVVHYG